MANIEIRPIIPQISIIVPIFNTEQYLDRCIQSLVNQTESTIEIILVNDGSSDSSRNICNMWAQKDSRIRVIHKNNEGVTIARKTGVESASGEWICFVDSDDELPVNSIHTLFIHTGDSIDIVTGSIKYTGRKKWPFKYYYKELNALQYTKSLLRYKIYGGPVARLIRKELFDSFIFDIPANITIGEDFIMNIRLGQKAKRIILLPEIVYHYIWRKNSALSNSHNFMRNNKTVMNNLLAMSIRSEYRVILKNSILYYYYVNQWKFIKSIVKLHLITAKNKL
jgi:glycosyltransferase involved in cell wall biosynthesis